MEYYQQVIFFTTLFYLLAGSDKQYMPVQLLGGTVSKSSKPNSIATAIQDAIRWSLLS